MYVLLDKDFAGRKAREEIINGEVYKTRHQNLPIKIANIQPSNEIINLHNKHIDFLYEIEHLCSVKVWEGWKEQELVTVRQDAEIRNMFEGLIPRDKSLDNVIDDLIEDIEIRDTILTFEPKKLKKKQMVSYLKNNYSEDINAFLGFTRTIKDIEKFFEH